MKNYLVKIGDSKFRVKANDKFEALRKAKRVKFADGSVKLTNSNFKVEMDKISKLFPEERITYRSWDYGKRPMEFNTLVKSKFKGVDGLAFCEVFTFSEELADDIYSILKDKFSNIVYGKVENRLVLLVKDFY